MCVGDGGVECQPSHVAPFLQLGLRQDVYVALFIIHRRCQPQPASSASLPPMALPQNWTMPVKLKRHQVLQKQGHLPSGDCGLLPCCWSYSRRRTSGGNCSHSAQRETALPRSQNQTGSAHMSTEITPPELHNALSPFPKPETATGIARNSYFGNWVSRALFSLTRVYSQGQLESRS